MNVRRWVWLLTAVFVIAALALAACGGDDDGGSGGIAGPGGLSAGKDAATKAAGGSSGSVGAGSSSSGSCEVNLTGDMSLSWKGRGGASAVSADYWYGDDEMKKMVGAFKSANETVDDLMKKDPRLFLLILNCSSSQGGGLNSITLIPSNESRYKDVPFQPGEYVIPIQGALGGANKPGEFNVLLSAGDRSFKVTEAGKLKITKWDKAGIAGSFGYKGEEVFPDGAPKKVTVEGKFDFACPAGDNCKK